MKKIVLINQSSGYLMIDIVNKYAQLCDDVVFMYGSLEEWDTVVNQKIRHSKLIKYNRSSIISRLFTWCWATMQIFIRLLFIL